MKRIRVLIADDSSTLRATLRTLLDQEPDIEVVGQAGDGHEAIALAKSLLPDVITMDIQMPRLDGLSAIAAIMAEAPSRILVVASTSEHRQVDLSLKAIELGALEVLAKPSGDAHGFGRRLAESIRLMSEVPVIRRRGRPLPVPEVPRPVAVGGAVGIVASTGGPPILAGLLAGLPADYPFPIFIAQHIAPGFASGLARWFASVARLRVALAYHGEIARAGKVYLAPDGHDLESIDGVVHLSPNHGGPCPSGDRLLRSLARCYGMHTAGVVLTGMGSDGADGLLSIARAGGQTWAQDQGSSVVFGMPHAAFGAGATRRLLDPPGILRALLDFARVT